MPQLTGKGKLHLQEGEVIFDETVLRVADTQVEGKGHVRWTEKGISISESQWTVHGVPISLTGQIAWTRAGLTYTLHLSTPKLAVATLRAIPPL